MFSNPSIFIICIAMLVAWISIYATTTSYNSIAGVGRALRSTSNNENEPINLIVVLGSDNNRLLEDRMDVALTTVREIKGDVVWYLTGGVKRYNDKGGEKITEASKMLNILKNEGNTHSIIVDDKAKNTAENFVKLKGWLENIDEDINIHIVTSGFHHIRAKAMLDLIMPDVEVTWNLGYISCATCLSDEMLHRQNVKSDVEKALTNEDEINNAFQPKRYRKGHTLDPIPEYIDEDTLPI